MSANCCPIPTMDATRSRPRSRSPSSASPSGCGATTTTPRTEPTAISLPVNSAVSSVRHCAPRLIIASERSSVNSPRPSDAISSQVPAPASVISVGGSWRSHSTVSSRCARTRSRSLPLDSLVPIRKPAACSTTSPSASTMSRSASIVVASDESTRTRQYRASRPAPIRRSRATPCGNTNPPSVRPAATMTVATDWKQASSSAGWMP